MIIQNFSELALFVAKDRKKIASSCYIHASKIISKQVGITKEGLDVAYYGWICTYSKNEKYFHHLSLEVQTLIWAICETGCFYMNIKFDIEPAKFKKVPA